MSRIEQTLSQLDEMERTFGTRPVKLTSFGTGHSYQLDTDAYPDFTRWRRLTLAALEHVFGSESRQASEFADFTFTAWVEQSENDPRGTQAIESERLAAFINQNLGRARSLLTSFLDEVHEFWDDEMVATPSSVAQLNERTATTPPSRDVFIVYGHDDGLKEGVARFLSRLQFNPLILHEQPEQGRTIIEKFHDYASVAYAFTLFTPDDIGAQAGTPDAVHPRARQNVVFELGFFIGRLGRTRACALVKQDVEMPSDFSGIVYIPVDDEGNWRFRLAKELKAAGFEIDANLLL